MLDDYRELTMKNYKHIVGWGTGSHYQATVDPGEHHLLRFLVDNNRSKWGTSINGTPVCPPDELQKLPTEDTIIVVFSSFFAEIAQNIKAQGHNNYIPARAWVALHLQKIENEICEAESVQEPPSSVASLYFKRAGLLMRMGLHWQVISSLEKALELDAADPEWHRDMGIACERMNRFDRAAEALQKNIELSQQPTPDQYYDLGYALERAEKTEEARAAYDEAIQLHSSKLPLTLGAGFFHYKRSRSDLAIREWQLCRKDNDTPILSFRLGRAYERCFLWAEAAGAYSRAISLSPKDFAFWQMRLGFCFERLELWDAAAQAYATGVAKATRNCPVWNYRLGTVLKQTGKHLEACQAFLNAYPANKCQRSITAEPTGLAKDILQAIKLDATHARDWYVLGNAYLQENKPAEAADAFEQALARDDEQHPEGFYLWGKALCQAGQMELACEAFAAMHVLARASLIPAPKKPDPIAHYNAFRESQPIAEKTVLYESQFGKSISCNPNALFRHLLERKEFAGWRHVWVISDQTRIPEAIRHRTDVTFITRGKPLYQRMLATAKYLITNLTFPYQFSRRPEQCYLNTWHGTPLKTIGADVKDGELFDYKNVARNLLHATHICSPNEHTSDVLKRAYHLTGVFSGQIAETGYPRVDNTLNQTQAERKKLKQKLGITSNTPVVLYAPTWRGTQGHESCDTIQLQHDMQRLSELPIQLLFRGHHFTEKLLAPQQLGVQIVPGDIDTNELLAVVDILITDYSSIFFDFLPLNRPILFYTYDEQEYVQYRGLYFQMNDMPGKKCSTIKSLQEALADIINGTHHDLLAENQRACNQFCSHDDGRAAERVVNWVFLDETVKTEPATSENNTSILFYMTSFIPNGITTSALNLLANVSTGNEPVTLNITVNPNVILSDPERLKKFTELPGDINIFALVGRMNLSPEEEWLIARLARRFTLDSDAMWISYAHAYKKEYDRLFGGATFDCMIEFEGYSLYWVSLFAFGGTNDTRKAVYLHNAMDDEQRTRFPHLTAIFQLYNCFNALISVSESVSDHNRAMLSLPYGIDENKFVHCENMVNAKTIQALANDNVTTPLADERSGCKTNFITVGRLSPEKGHEKLLNAFANVLAKHPDVHLWILGDGPLKATLVKLTELRHINHAVHFLGFQSNPYVHIRHAECLVLSSDYEGQGLVLLEAMILGVPVIATDVVGASSLLKNHPSGQLVHNSAKGLEKGMLDFIEKHMYTPPFDVKKYQQMAISDFYEKVLEVKI